MLFNFSFSQKPFPSLGNWPSRRTNVSLAQCLPRTVLSEYCCCVCGPLQPLGGPVPVWVKQAGQSRDLFSFLSKSYAVSVCEYFFF